MTVIYSEPVILVNSSGSPRLNIVVGTTNRPATYVSGSGSDNFTFQYTIVAGENDTDGISIGADALVLPSGSTIQDSAGNDAALTHNAVSNNQEFKVDTTAPAVDNFTMSDTALKIGDNATVTLIFSEQICPVTDSCAIGFNNSDIDVPDVTGTSTDTGTLSTLATHDNVSWTGTFIPTDNIEDNTSCLLYTSPSPRD